METRQHNLGTPGKEGTSGQKLGTLLQDHKGPEGSDLWKFVSYAHVILQIDYAHLAADDFRV